MAPGKYADSDAWFETRGPANPRTRFAVFDEAPKGLTNGP